MLKKNICRLCCGIIYHNEFSGILETKSIVYRDITIIFQMIMKFMNIQNKSVISDSITSEFCFRS